MPPHFSIITVTYNARKALERTLQSVGVQTYGEMEYFVIDGGSTDGTMERVARWEAEMADERTRRGMEPMRCVTVSEPDRGLYDAMNKGLQRATMSGFSTRVTHFGRQRLWLNWPMWPNETVGQIFFTVRRT